jgi:hypothetical protein
MRSDRDAAPLVFGALLGAVVAGLMMMTLIAFRVRVPSWLDKVIFYGLTLVVGPLVVRRYTLAHPNWVETGVQGKSHKHRAHLPNDR